MLPINMNMKQLYIVWNC